MPADSPGKVESGSEDVVVKPKNIPDCYAPVRR